jgi:hypothetical protein
MSRSATKPTLAITVFAALLAPASLAVAATSTSRGQISVVQVAEMLEKAATDRTAQQVLVAYLGGVGEAASAVATMGGASCRTSLSLSSANAHQALKAAVAAPNAAEIAATPLIVRDMLERADCSRR